MTLTSASADVATPLGPTVAGKIDLLSRIKLFIASLIVVLIAELIGTTQLQIGPGKVVLLPMLWALLIGASWGLGARYIPSAVRITTGQQSWAGNLLNAGLWLFLIKLGLNVGGSLEQVRQAGWALLFQEFGHTLGTLALGLPLALMLGIKREAVGATFSIGRENNLAIIAEKYGMVSPEGRGVLAEYITGTVLGALFIAMLAGFVTSLNIFDPRSLAMGAGVGSGSMMAAATGAIVAQQPAGMVPQLTAIAAASNLLTTVIGFYITLFLSLPLCSWLYDRLEPRLGRFSRRQLAEVEASTSIGEAEADKLSFADTLVAWVLMTAGVMIGNLLAYKVSPLESLTGMLFVVAIAALVDITGRLLPKLPVVLLLSAVATIVGIPGLFPFSGVLIAATAKLNFLAFTTPMLALAGFSVAKDMPIFRKLGWRIVVVSLTAAAGTFLGATLIAELFHRL